MSYYNNWSICGTDYCAFCLTVNQKVNQSNNDPRKWMDNIRAVIIDNNCRAV